MGVSLNPITVTPISPSHTPHVFRRRACFPSTQTYLFSRVFFAPTEDAVFCRLPCRFRATDVVFSLGKFEDMRPGEDVLVAGIRRVGG